MPKSAVLLLVYNRPLFVEKQLSLLLEQSQVSHIYVAGDGPKKNSHDRKQVGAVRAVVNKFARKFPRRFSLHFSDSNLGCRRGVERGIDWFFDHVDHGIILEDDCRPEESFFRYCTELLDRYRDDQRVGMISGTKPILNIDVDDSYFFTHHSMVWGWATWKRSWSHYHFIQKHGLALLQSPTVRRALLGIITPHQFQVIEKVLAGHIDTWDYIWYLTNILQSRYCILPSQNLISNVGFTPEATHTKLKTIQSELPVTPLTFPMRHPTVVLSSAEFDRRYLQQQERWRVLISVAWAYGREVQKKLSA